MKRQYKHQNVTQVKFSFDGGLNYAAPAHDVADNEMKRATNWMYDPSTDILMVRPGTACVDTRMQTFYNDASTTADWTPSCCEVVTDAGGYSGTCLSLNRTDGGATITYIGTAFSADLVTDAKYAISFYVKSGTMGNVPYNVNIDHEGVTTRHQFAGTSSTTWTEVTSEFTAAGNEDHILLYSTEQNTTGTMLFDEILLSRIDFPDSIRALHYYEKSAADAWLCAASGSTLYALSSTNSWDTIGALSDSSTVPSMLTFNNKLLIADGNADIRTWDGTTYTTIATSPKASALGEIGNRVVANATDEPDSVYMSGPEDETIWNTTTTAIGLKAGYGDMLEVNGFGVYGTNLIVSKKGNFKKRLYRVDTSDATPANWTISQLSENNAAQNPQSLCGAYNNVFFADGDGFKSVAGIERYGDLAVDPIGNRINSIFANLTSYGTIYIPKYNCIFILLGSRVFTYTERLGNPRFTDLLFKQGSILSMAQAGNTVYLGGNNGFLYKFDDSASTDETSPGVEEQFVSTLRSKTFASFSDIIVRRVQTFINPLIAGAGTVSIVTSDQTEIPIQVIDIPVTTLTLTGGEYLYDATTYLDDLTGYLYDLGAMPYVVNSRGRARAVGFSIQVYISSGRCGLDRVQAEVAMLEGGE